MTTITALNCKQLVEKRTPARIAQAELRLATWRMSPKNVRRLTDFVGQPEPVKAAPVKAARPTGVGSRGGDPVKAARMATARAIAAEQGIVPFAGDKAQTKAFWVIYRATA